MRRKERPLCRKAIEKLLEEHKTTLNELLSHPHRLSKGLRIQARKMREEERG